METYLGYDAGGTGSATITSGALDTTYLYIGESGTGTLMVDGGTVTNTSGHLGRNSGSHGSAMVTSGTWISYFLHIGSLGTGSLTVDGGTVTSYGGSVASLANSHGSTTVTSGSWDISTDLYVGNYGSGTIAENGGTVANSTGHIGSNSNSFGSATVTGGLWKNTSALFIGSSGTGTLMVSGGIVLVSGTTFTSRYATGNGTVTLAGDKEHQGVLETRAIAKGFNASSIGTGKVFFDGGLVRALADTGDFFLRYRAGDITLNSGGAFVDTNGYTIGINAPLGGVGALHKIGLGTLTLGGSNAYAGGTVVEAGTLAAAHRYALGTGAVTVKSGATFTIQSGVTVANAILLEGGSLSQTVATGANLTGAINASTTLGMTTGAKILDGTTSGVTALQASFAVTSGAENDNVRLGGVLHLSGMHVINIDTGETDQFVLQLQVGGVSDSTILGWLDTQTNQWLNAVAGNIGGMANFLGDKAYNAATDFQLGNYGVDTVNGTVWAVLNHNSEFAVVPEPGMWALLALGAGAVMHRARKRRKM